jgi:MFS family permease
VRRMITQSFSKTYKGWVLFLCFLMMASNYIDRSIITILAQPIKEAFALSDMQVGALGGLAFAALYIVAGFPLARLADRHNRVNIISISLAVWSAMTALCGIAQSYLHLLLFRVGVGIGEAGASPAAQSLLCDYFPPSRRASAFSVFSFGGPMGGLFGAIAAGAIAQSYGWRAAFLLVGVPGIALALLFKFTTREPVRGSQDVPSQATADAVTVPSLWAVTRHLFGKSTFVQIAAGAAVANFALQGILQFTAAMFVRRFAVGLAEAGLVMGLIGGLCGGLGILAGGFGTDWAGKRDARWYLWLPAAGLVLCTPLYVMAFLQSSWRASTAMLMVPAALSYVFIAPMLSVTQNLVGPRMRATAVALLTLVTASVGVALGPIAVGWLSDHLAARNFAHFGIGEFATICRWNGAAPGPDTVRAACRTASAAGVTQAVIASTFLLLWAGLHFLIASRSIRRDLMANAS